jgi:site-specific DNA-methyltransferase (adenine-specific)
MDHESQLTGLLKFDAAKAALEVATSVDEVVEIRNRAEAMRVYARQAHFSLKMQNQCCELKVRAERRAGELLKEMELDKGGGDRKSDNYKNHHSHDATSDSFKLSDIGISKDQSSRWQSIASIPEKIFDDHISEITKDGEKELTSAELLRLAKQIKMDEKFENLRQQVSTTTNDNILTLENAIHCANCIEFMEQMDANTIDLTITSPPYDDLRNLVDEFDYQGIAKGLYRITKPGGVVVWVVADATINGSETGTSFKQSLYFKEIGFNLNDTMIYDKTGTRYPFCQSRYIQSHEYMFVLSKWKPKTFSPIRDEPKLWEGSWSGLSVRNKDGSLSTKILENEGLGASGRAEGTEYGFKPRTNVWRINNGYGFGHKDEFAYLHHSTFPLELSTDHIVTWSHPGDLVFDPMCGAGTTCVSALLNNRRFIGVDISEEYCQISRKRLEIYKSQVKL